MNMRVAIDISPTVYGTGVSDYLVNLVSHLPPSNILPFGYSLRRQAELKKFFPSAKVLPFPPRFMHHLWNRLHVINVENFIGPVDIVHSSDWAQPPATAKKVTTVHDLSPFLFPKETHPRILRVHKARMKWVVGECDSIICVSRSTQSDLHALFPTTANRTVVIPEALPDRFKLTPQSSPYQDYVVAIGARQPRKNIDRLIQAKLPCKLVIIGENSGFKDPNVIFTGVVSDQSLVNIVAGSHALVYPSLYEGFGLPVLIAFSLGVPVACSNTSCFPQVAGEAAVYFDPTSPPAIATGVAKAISSRKKLLPLGRTQLANFSWDQTADQTLAVYHSLC